MPRRKVRENGTAAADAAATHAEGKTVAAPVRAKKIDQVVALLRREEGATLAEMIEATGWLPHTTRAALTGLKKIRDLARTGIAKSQTNQDELYAFRGIDDVYNHLAPVASTPAWAASFCALLASRAPPRSSAEPGL